MVATTYDELTIRVVHKRKFFTPDSLIGNSGKQKLSLLWHIFHTLIFTFLVVG